VTPPVHNLRLTIPTRAAQYVRMSTEHQQYSPGNQTDAIEAYAVIHQMKIVRTYSDHGRSGLNLAGREGLLTLLSEVANNQTDFSILLVYDVSRWGRFQDADESAYYEYVLKKSGIRIHYCAAPFINDESLASVLFKTIKRTMAGEYSRELSSKVFAGQCHLAGLGFRQGGVAGYGFRRQLVDKNGTPKSLLEPGEHKSIQTDRVILIPGPRVELDVVASIYKSFATMRKGETAIAAELNSHGVTAQFGKPWTHDHVHQILVDQKYIGIDLYNRTSGKLKHKRTLNPRSLWIRSGNVLKPLVTTDDFQNVQARLRARSRVWTDPELLDGLRQLLGNVGQLSSRIIDEAGSIPRGQVYVKRFGGLNRAYSLIGWRPSRDSSYCEVNRRLGAQRRILLESILKSITDGSATTDIADPRGLLTINRGFTASVRLARCYDKPDGLYWRVHTDSLKLADFSLIARMCEGNGSILDYYVIPSSEITVRKLCFRNINNNVLHPYRFDDLDSFLSLCRQSQIGCGL
jgi:DNA invertase Pin-like site-specific DNA recombinase